MIRPGNPSAGRPVVLIVNTVKALRYVSIFEASSFVLLLAVAMPLKYGAGTPQGVQLMGPIHGVLFLAYVALVFMVREQLRWDGRRTVQALIASVIPFAPFYVERKWLTAQQPEPATPLHEPVG